MSENFRKMQIESSKRFSKSQKPLEKFGQSYQNNDSAKLREKQEFEKMQKRLQLILEGSAIEHVANQFPEFLICELRSVNFSGETEEFMKLTKEIYDLMFSLKIHKRIIKSRQIAINKLKSEKHKLEKETQIWLESTKTYNFIVTLSTAKDFLNDEKLLLAKLDEFVIICDKLGISANKIIALLAENYLTDLD